jgi:hypothetical protein
MAVLVSQPGLNIVSALRCNPAPVLIMQYELTAPVSRFHSPFVILLYLCCHGDIDIVTGASLFVWMLDFWVVTPCGLVRR